MLSCTLYVCSIVVLFVPGVLPTIYARRAGTVRICTTGKGCHCQKPTECFDFTRERRGICNLDTHSCYYCLYGYHLEANHSTDFYTGFMPQCKRSDTCEVQRDYSGKELEVECVNDYCVREGYTTDEECICEDGFVMKKMWDGRRRCTDSNECESAFYNECYPMHCINTEGGHRCGCRSGYRMMRSNYGHKYCEEIDECKEVIGLCPQACRNIPGTFNCTCHPGYTPTYERGKLICVDIDECQIDACPPLMTCYNNVGSYHCAMPLQAPQSAFGWATLLIPLIAIGLVIGLVYKNRQLHKEVVRRSREDLLEEGQDRYKPSPTVVARSGQTDEEKPSTV